MIYIITLLNVLIPMLFFLVSYDIDNKMNAITIFAIFGIIYINVIEKEILIPVFHDSILTKISSVTGMISFSIYDLLIMLKWIKSKV